MAIALASHGPIQIGRYRSRSDSLRMTTCWLESMWTRTLSTTISLSRTRPKGWSRIESILVGLLEDDPDHRIRGEQRRDRRAIGH